MALNSEGLPLGLELDAAAGRDRDLLALARRVEKASGACRDPLGSKLQARRTYGPRLYWDNKANKFNAVDISVRAAITVFPGEIYHVPRSWAERR